MNTNASLNPGFFTEDIEHQKTARQRIWGFGSQKIHFSVDSLTGDHADALIPIPDLRYRYINNILFESQFLRCGPKGS